MKLRTKRHACSERPPEVGASDRPVAVDASLHLVDEAIKQMCARHVVPAQEVVDLLLDLRSAVTLGRTSPALAESASVS